MPDENPNAFIGRSGPPEDADLAAALGPAKPAWDALLASLAADHDATIQVWKSYSPKHGWALQVLRKTRRVLWLAPCQGWFEATLLLGERALETARSSRLSARGRKAFGQAKKYPEGTAVRLAVQGPKDLPDVKRLVSAKLAT